MRKLVFSSRLLKAGLFMSLMFGFAFQAVAQDDEPSIVQPGAPGQETKDLPKDKNAILLPITKQDVEFMQGMIMHHAQAVEMTALIEARTEHKGIRSLGARISQTQAEEIKFMERWLTMRGQKTTMSGMTEMSDMKNEKDMDHKKMDHSKMNHDKMDHKKMNHDKKDTGHGGNHSMPGMLTPKQMEALRNAKGREFDELFLKGMIQHHVGALVMVEDLFNSPGSGQDAEIFTFATDVDNTQRAEIKIMQTMLEKNP